MNRLSALEVVTILVIIPLSVVAVGKRFGDVAYWIALAIQFVSVSSYLLIWRRKS